MLASQVVPERCVPRTKTGLGCARGSIIAAVEYGRAIGGGRSSTGAQERERERLCGSFGPDPGGGGRPSPRARDDRRPTPARGQPEERDAGSTEVLVASRWDCMVAAHIRGYQGAHVPCDPRAGATAGPVGVRGS